MSFATNIGLASGIDFNQLISSIRAVNSRPISLILNNRSLAEQRNSAMEQIKTALLDLKSKGDALNSNDNFLSMTASSTDGNVVLASASNEAVAGDFGVKVLQLAQTHRIAAQGAVDQDSTAISTGAGTFDFKIGDGATTSVEVTNGMTLNQLRDAINAEDANVRASVVNDGSATNPYRLVLTSEDSGSDNALTIVNNDTNLNFSGTTIEQAAAATSNQFDGTITSSGAYTGANTKNIIIEVTTAGAVGAAQYKVSYDGGLTFTADDAFTTSTSAVDVTGASAENVLATFGAGALDFKIGDRFTIDAFNPLLQQA